MEANDFLDFLDLNYEGARNERLSFAETVLVGWPHFK